MKKVLLTKEQAASLESAKSIDVANGSDHANIISWKVTDLFSGEEEALNQLDLDTLIRALYVGFEIEKGPEEKVKEYFDSFNDDYEKDIIIITLNLLGIQIYGVN